MKKVIISLVILSLLTACAPSYSEVNDYLAVNGKFSQSIYTGLIFGYTRLNGWYHWALTSATGIELSHGGPLAAKDMLALVMKYTEIGFMPIDATQIPPATWQVIIAAIVSRIPFWFGFFVWTPTIYKAPKVIQTMPYPAP